MIIGERGRASLTSASIDDFSNSIVPFILINCQSALRKSFPFSLFIYLYQQGFINSYFIQRVIILNDDSCLCFIFPLLSSPPTIIIFFLQSKGEPLPDPP